MNIGHAKPYTPAKKDDAGFKVWFGEFKAGAASFIRDFFQANKTICIGVIGAMAILAFVMGLVNVKNAMRNKEALESFKDEVAEAEIITDDEQLQAMYEESRTQVIEEVNTEMMKYVEELFAKYPDMTAEQKEYITKYVSSQIGSIDYSDIEKLITDTAKTAENNAYANANQVASDKIRDLQTLTEDKINYTVTNMTSELTTVTSEFEKQLAAAKAQLQANIDQNNKTLSDTIVSTKSEIAGNLAKNKSEMEGTLAGTRSELSENMAKNKSEMEDVIAGTKTEIIGNLESTKKELGGSIESAKKDMSDELATAKSQMNSDITSNASNIKTNSDAIAALAAKVESCFTSVSNGKNKLATLLTNKGVATATDASFDTIAAGINTLADGKYNAGYNEGYSKGVSDGIAQAKGKIEYVRHNHTGSATGGGCYSQEVFHVHKSGCYQQEYTECGSTEWTRLSYAGGISREGYDGTTWTDEYWNGVCAKCGAYKECCKGYDGLSKTESYLTCTARVATGNKLICGKSTSTIEQYCLGCGYSEGQILEAKIKF